MSYNVGQFRKDMLDGTNSRLLNKINIQIDNYQFQSDFSQSIKLRDKIFAIQNSSSFSSEKYYYIKMEILMRQDNPQNFSIYLMSSEDTQKGYQLIKNIFIPKQQVPNKEEYVTIEFVFNPAIVYNNIYLKMNRIGQDFLQRIPGEPPEKNLYGRVAVVKNYECYEIVNVLNIINNNNQNSSIVNFAKIGVQGPSGLLMCINGEEIRVWPSGIYEIRNGYKVSFIGFVVLDDNVSFILDYQY